MSWSISSRLYEKCRNANWQPRQHRRGSSQDHLPSQLMIHEYFRVDLELAWEMVQDDLPALAAVVSKILEDEGLRNQGAL